MRLLLEEDGPRSAAKAIFCSNVGPVNSLGESVALSLRTVEGSTEEEVRRMLEVDAEIEPELMPDPDPEPEPEPDEGVFEGMGWEGDVVEEAERVRPSPDLWFRSIVTGTFVLELGPSSEMEIDVGAVVVLLVVVVSSFEALALVPASASVGELERMLSMSLSASDGDEGGARVYLLVLCVRTRFT